MEYSEFVIFRLDYLQSERIPIEFDLFMEEDHEAQQVTRFDRDAGGRQHFPSCNRSGL
jgi:hypothetical protein